MLSDKQSLTFTIMFNSVCYKKLLLCDAVISSHLLVHTFTAIELYLIINW